MGMRAGLLTFAACICVHTGELQGGYTSIPALLPPARLHPSPPAPARAWLGSSSLLHLSCPVPETNTNASCPKYRLINENKLVFQLLSLQIPSRHILHPGRWRLMSNGQGSHWARVGMPETRSSPPSLTGLISIPKWLLPPRASAPGRRKRYCPGGGLCMEAALCTLTPRPLLRQLTQAGMSVPYGQPCPSCTGLLYWAGVTVPAISLLQHLPPAKGHPGADTSSKRHPPGTVAGPYFPSQKPQRHPRQPLRIWREASTISVALTSSRREKRTTFQATMPSGSRQVLQVRRSYR